ncbi:PIG-L family deacetylase [soil metagenome]
MHRFRPFLFLLCAVLLLPAPPAAAQAGGGAYSGAVELGLALRRLGTTARVLMIGAHPDDEYTPLLAELALKRGADVAYLSLTRGEGGQNGVGPELGPALGLLRTEELLAARRVDGATQFFSRAYDFGYSKNAEEAFRHWPRDSLLADVVGVVRVYRPDVIVSVFSGTPADGHGQHQVAGILAREAFRVAGDPTRFPAQLAAGLRPWNPRKLYQALWRDTASATLRVPVGGLDPLLGRSPYQVALASRGLHRSQDMARAEPPGPRTAYLRRLDVRAASPVPADSGFFASVDTRLDAGRLPASERRRVGRVLDGYLATARRLRAEFNPLRPWALLPELARQVERLRAAVALLAGDTAAAAAELRFRLAAERADVRTALARAAGIELDAVTSREQVVSGDTFAVTASVWNGGDAEVRLAELAPELPAGWAAEPLDPLPPAVAPGALVTRRFRVRVAADAPPSEAYFLRRPLDGDLYVWPNDWSVRARPFGSPPVTVRTRLEVAGTDLALAAEATASEVDPRSGERRLPLRVVPEAWVAVTPATTVLSTAPGASDTLLVRVEVTAAKPDVAGTVRLDLPAGWSSTPDTASLRFAGAGDRGTAEFTVRAPRATAPGSYPVGAVFEVGDGKRFTRGYQLVDYPHVAPQPLYHPAVTMVEAFDLRVPRQRRVAYVTGAGEAGPEVLAPLGIAPTVLDEAALERGDLDRFDVIVLGSRAYEVRPDLAAANSRLLDWVRRGGTLIVQYNKYEYVEGGFAPYPLAFDRPHDRVTDEAAAVQLLEPDHPLLSRPNRITERDFAGWIQERGLYFAHEWDPHYTPLLQMHDPGDPPLRGGLLVTRYGEGWYVYTGLAFFRQLPAGVPGAYRLFANLLALGGP